MEDHPISYRNFEGIIPDGEYGAGVVVLFDRGKYKEIESFKKTFKKGYLKFKLLGKRLRGNWTLIKYKDNNWLLLKENDGIKLYNDIKEFPRSIKSNKTMEEIRRDIVLTNKDKIIYKKDNITKQDIFNYYKKVSSLMLPYIKDRYLTTVRAPKGVDEEVFFKKHFSENKHLYKKGDYYYIKDEIGLLSEVQMNSIEFHVGGGNIKNSKYANVMVFDLDPDEKLSIENLREGVKDLKKILDSLKLKSYLKTSGGKGYHILVPFKENITYKKMEKISYNIAKIMVEKYPDKYTTNMSKKERKDKIFIDYLRNKKGSTTVAPYSLRIRKTPSVSLPIKWSELSKVTPNQITITDTIKRIKRKNPWGDFFD